MQEIALGTHRKRADEGLARAFRAHSVKLDALFCSYILPKPIPRQN